MSHSRVFQLETFKKSEYDKHDVEELNEFSLEQNQFPPQTILIIGRIAKM